jgi:transposase
MGSGCEGIGNISVSAQYGLNLRALSVHLTRWQFLPFARAAQLIQDLYGIAVSPGAPVSRVSGAIEAHGRAHWCVIASRRHAAMRRRQASCVD